MPRIDDALPERLRCGGCRTAHELLRAEREKNAALSDEVTRLSAIRLLPVSEGVLLEVSLRCMGTLSCCRTCVATVGLKDANTVACSLPEGWSYVVAVGEYQACCPACREARRS